MTAVLWISLGAVGGALARWVVGLWLNPMFNTFALGTLFANWLGCFLIGIAMAFSLSDNTKLLVITGFLGSFTTLSALSAEVTENLLHGKWLAAFGVFGLHSLGGFALTLLGVYLAKR